MDRRSFIKGVAKLAAASILPADLLSFQEEPVWVHTGDMADFYHRPVPVSLTVRAEAHALLVRYHKELCDELAIYHLAGGGGLRVS